MKFFNRAVNATVLRQYATILLGCLIGAASYPLFLEPAHIAPGGLTGITTILNYYFHWPIGLTSLVLNLPLLLLGWRERAAIDARVAELLAEVDLAGLGPRRPRELSGGQLQRVAIARALVHRPALILADEPTGNLDPRTAQRVLDLLVGQARRHRAGCLIVTHSESAAAQADRRLRLRADGIEALR